jgi:hypothetical protein
MVALNRFISKLGERGLPFFKLLKHQEKFAWTPEADQALAQLKDFLSKPPALTAPRKKEQLLLYLAATTHVVSTAIVVERQEDGHAYLVQRPVYNVAVAVLSKLGSTRAQVPAGVFVHEVHAPSIPEPAPPTTLPAHPLAGQEVMLIDVDWRQPFIDYLSEQKIPSDTNLSEQLIRRAKSYVLVKDKLYRRGASSGVLMKCVPRQEGKDILEEIHNGVCGNHASSHTLVNKAF